MPYEPDLLTAWPWHCAKSTRSRWASGVVPIQNQHPMLLAQRALTLNQIAGGRFLLGLGMTHQAVTEGMWGIPWDKPVRRHQRISRRLASRCWPAKPVERGRVRR